MTPSPPDPATILRSIVSLPRDEQVRLARAILDQAARPDSGSATMAEAATHASSFAMLYGLAATDRTPPSDEQVAEWLDERRMRHLDETGDEDTPR